MKFEGEENPFQITIDLKGQRDNAQWNYEQKTISITDGWNLKNESPDCSFGGK